jgi:hypothetical protein
MTTSRTHPSTEFEDNVPTDLYKPASNFVTFLSKNCISLFSCNKSLYLEESRVFSSENMVISFSPEVKLT